MNQSLPYSSIIIPTKNAQEKIDLVLKAIFKSRVDFDYEVIIIDSGSADRTKEIISNYPINLIEMPPQSFSHGGTRNLAAAKAKGEILIFLSQDAVPENENWLSNLTRDFNDKEVAGVYGRQVPNEDSSPLEIFFLDYTYPDSKIVKDSVNPDDCTLKDIFFSNVNSAIRKSDWSKNRFNENLIMSEDQEWAKRMLLEARKIVYEPEAVVYHCHHYTIKEIIKRNFDSGLSLRGIVNAPIRRKINCEMDYLKSGLSYMLKNIRNRFYLLTFFFFEALRAVGFFMGSYSRFLPLAIKKTISQNKIYWQNKINNRSCQKALLS
jgi:rhamnosyltransferase